MPPSYAEHEADFVPLVENDKVPGFSTPFALEFTGEGHFHHT
jgi:hypothetical protein